MPSTHFVELSTQHRDDRLPARTLNWTLEIILLLDDTALAFWLNAFGQDECLVIFPCGIPLLRLH